MNKNLIALIFCAFLVACVARETRTSIPEKTPTPTLMPTATPLPTPAYNAEKASKVDALFNEFISENSPGGVVLVIHDGEIRYEAAYGLADLENDIPLTPQHIFHLGSVGKQFTALAIMLLVEQSQLNYDDPIGKYLPELTHFGENLTIRHLLQHTSGIPDYYEDHQLMTRLLERAALPTNEDAIALLSEVGQLEFEPGDQFRYSNTGYEILGTLIERVSGQSYAQYVKDNIFTPLGMVHTFSLPDSAMLADPNLAHSYISLDDQVKVYDADPLDGLIGSGSIYSTVGDLYLYDQALYTNQLIDQRDLAEAFTPGILNNGNQTDYGFAWYLLLEPPSRIVAHSGHWLGFVANYVRFPEQNFSIIVLLNRDYDLPPLKELMFRIADVYESDRQE